MSEFIQLEWQRFVVLAILFSAPLTLLSLLFVSAPYGRHSRKGWGPVVPGRLSWFAMEFPTLLLFPLVFWLGPNRSVAALLLALLWLLHYVHRTLIFPFRLASTKPMPLVIILMAIVFQSANSYANGAWLGHFGDYSNSWMADPRFIGGVLLFVAGEAINLHADTVLIGLRKPGETGYKIPTGGAYKYVTCPNYLGEIIAWSGFAIASWSLAGLAFAAYTVANLAPRAATNHAWYLSKFGNEYPRERKRLIPFVW